MNRVICALVASVALCGAVLSAAPSPSVAKVREWRAAHERQIVAELMQLVSLPNIAANKADIVKNADVLTSMFEKRGFTVARVQTPGSPVLIARRDAANAVGTLTFYMHYDGQPTEAKDWTIGQPFTPVAMLGQTRFDLASPSAALSPDLRIYGRAVADDKGPIVALLFYDGVVPLTAAERRAIDEIPNVDQKLLEQFGLARAEHPDSRIELQHNRPTLTVAGLQSGTVGANARNAISGTATGRVEMRLVNGLDEKTQFDRLVAHIREQGYFIVNLRVGHLWEAIDIFAALVTMSRQ